MAATHPVSFDQNLNANAELAVGWKLESYAAGTSTPLTTYSDESLTTPNANPAAGATTGNQVTDATGRFGAIYLQSAAYKFVLKDADGVTVWTLDNYNPDGGAVSLAEVPDNVLKIVDQVDATKRIQFQVSGVSTGTTRTLTVPDADFTLAKATVPVVSGLVYNDNTGTVPADNLAALEAARDEYPAGTGGPVLIPNEIPASGAVLYISGNFSEGTRKNIDLHTPMGLTVSGGSVLTTRQTLYRDYHKRVVQRTPTALGSGERNVGDAFQTTNQLTTGCWGRSFSTVHTGIINDGTNDAPEVRLHHYRDVRSGSMWHDWSVYASPLHPSSGFANAPGASQGFAMLAWECNPQNRHADHGYSSNPQSISNYIQGIAVVPETQDFLSELGGERRGYPTFSAFTVGQSLYTGTDTERTAKNYHGYRAGANSIAPNGRAFSAQGHASFLADATVNSGGSGYADGDILTVSGGTAIVQAQIEVTGVDGSGAITSAIVYIPGQYTANPSSPNTVSGGSGTGASLTLTMSTASEDPRAAFEALQTWKTGLDFTGASFRDSTDGDNQAIRLANGMGIAAKNVGGNLRRILHAGSNDYTYLSAMNGSVGIGFSTPSQAAIAARIDTSAATGAAYPTLKATSTDARLIAEGTATNINLVLESKGTGVVASLDAFQAPSFNAGSAGQFDGSQRPYSAKADANGICFSMEENSGLEQMAWGVDADGSAFLANSSAGNIHTTFHDDGGIILGSPTGGSAGAGTINIAGGYYVNGTKVLGAQQTTGVSEATFVENSGGTAVNVDSTFGGYTLQQVVQALQNHGLLA